jgi:hypothetical protein
VYLVREKKTAKLFAMKGDYALTCTTLRLTEDWCSPVETGNDPTEKNQTRINGTRYPRNSEPSLYRYTIPLVSIRRISLFLYGILYGWRVLSSSADPTWQVPTRGWITLLCGRGCCCAGVLASHGIYLSGPQTGEYVTLILLFSSSIGFQTC